MTKFEKENQLIINDYQNNFKSLYQDQLKSKTFQNINLVAMDDKAFEVYDEDMKKVLIQLNEQVEKFGNSIIESEKSIGKTSLVKNYSKLFNDNYNLITMIHNDSLEKDLSTFAMYIIEDEEEVELFDRFTNINNIPILDNQKLYNYLNNTNKNWLVLYDDASTENLFELQKSIPINLNKSNGSKHHIIITSKEHKLNNKEEFSDLVSFSLIPFYERTKSIFNILPIIGTNINSASEIEKNIFFYNKNESLKRGMIPEQIKHVVLGLDYNVPIPQDLPLSINEITFGWSYNIPFHEAGLPSSITKLTLGYGWNQTIIPGSLPNSIKLLEFGHCFNSILEIGSLPNSLKVLKFGHMFNRDIRPGVLPASLRILEFGYGFDQKLVKGSIPFGLYSLKLGHSFNQSFEIDVLPKTIRNIEFGVSFNKSIPEHTLPFGVDFLIFGQNFNQPLVGGCIPNSVSTLIFGDNFDQSISNTNTIPLSVTHLTVGKNFNQQICNLASSITHITWDSEYKFREDYLNMTVNHITFGDNFNRPIKGHLPNSITTLEFGLNFNQPIPKGFLPQGLISLCLGYKFNKQIQPNILPSSLIHLELSNDYNHAILPSTFPNSLKRLSMGQSFNKPLVLKLNLISSFLNLLNNTTSTKQTNENYISLLPNKIQSLHLGWKFNQPIYKGCFQEGITEISVGPFFSQIIQKDVLPLSLTTINVYGGKRNAQIFDNVSKLININYID